VILLDGATVQLKPVAKLKGRECIVIQTRADRTFYFSSPASTSGALAAEHREWLEALQAVPGVLLVQSAGDKSRSASRAAAGDEDSDGEVEHSDDDEDGEKKRRSQQANAGAGNAVSTSLATGISSPATINRVTMAVMDRKPPHEVEEYEEEEQEEEEGGYLPSPPGILPPEEEDNEEEALAEEEEEELRFQEDLRIAMAASAKDAERLQQQQANNNNNNRQPPPPPSRDPALSSSSPSPNNSSASSPPAPLRSSPPSSAGPAAGTGSGSGAGGAPASPANNTSAAALLNSSARSGASSVFADVPDEPLVDLELARSLGLIKSTKVATKDGMLEEDGGDEEVDEVASVLVALPAGVQQAWNTLMKAAQLAQKGEGKEKAGLLEGESRGVLKSSSSSLSSSTNNNPLSAALRNFALSIPLIALSASQETREELEDEYEERTSQEVTLAMREVMEAERAGRAAVAERVQAQTLRRASRVAEREITKAVAQVTVQKDAEIAELRQRLEAAKAGLSYNEYRARKGLDALDKEAEEVAAMLLSAAGDSQEAKERVRRATLRLLAGEDEKRLSSTVNGSGRSGSAVGHGNALSGLSGLSSLASSASDAAALQREHLDSLEHDGDNEDNNEGGDEEEHELLAAGPNGNRRNSRRSNATAATAATDEFDSANDDGGDVFNEEVEDDEATGTNETGEAEASRRRSTLRIGGPSPKLAEELQKYLAAAQASSSFSSSSSSSAGARNRGSSAASGASLGSTNSSYRPSVVAASPGAASFAALGFGATSTTSSAQPSSLSPSSILKRDSMNTLNHATSPTSGSTSARVSFAPGTRGAPTANKTAISEEGEDGLLE
jgi:hypothetical protein